MLMICFVTTSLASPLQGVGELYVAPFELFSIHNLRFLSCLYDYVPFVS